MTVVNGAGVFCRLGMMMPLEIIDLGGDSWHLTSSWWEHDGFLASSVTAACRRKMLDR